MTESKIVRDYAKMGAQLGATFAVMAEAGRAFNAAFDAAALRVRQHYAQAVQPLDPEVASIQRYCRRIEAERAAGHAHVRAEAQRVRRELGLPR